MDPVVALRNLVNACDKYLPEQWLDRLAPEYTAAVHALIHDAQERRAGWKRQ